MQRSGCEGFGPRLLSHGLAYELDGEVGLDFDASGSDALLLCLYQGTRPVRDRQRHAGEWDARRPVHSCRRRRNDSGNVALGYADGPWLPRRKGYAPNEGP